MIEERLYQRCLFCNVRARFRVGIDIELHDDLRAGFIYLCNKHITYLDKMRETPMMSYYVFCSREMR